MRRALVLLALVLAGCGSGGASTSTTTSSLEPTTTVAATTTSSDAICKNDRRKLEDAKAARSGNLSDPEGRQKVDDAARQARRDGCDISDLVGPNVGS